MGMYNEVFCTCPECGKQGYMQIECIVKGFGGFNLDNLDTLKELTETQLYELKDAIIQNDFVCDGDPNAKVDAIYSRIDPCELGCGAVFNPYKNLCKDVFRKRDLIKSLFG